MKDAKCLECGAESNSLLEIMHADWCPVPNRQPPMQGPLPDSTRALEKRTAALEDRVFVAEGRIDRVYVGPNPRLDDFELRLAKLERVEAARAGNSIVVGHIDMATGKTTPLTDDEIRKEAALMEGAEAKPYNPELWAGIGRWQEGDKIHTVECAMSKSAGKEPCDCWHSKVESNADKALDNKLTEERLTEHLTGVIGQRMARLERNSNHIEDTLISPIASGEAKIVSAADKYWGGGAPKKTKRKRKWWRLWL